MDSPSYWAHSAEPAIVSAGPGPAQPARTIPEGGVGRSAPRCTRSSRRAPTTILDTDTTNFLAMVQQFTGAPAGPYMSPAEPVISFGFGDRIQQQQPPMFPLGRYWQGNEGAVMLPGGNSSEGCSAAGFVFDGLTGGNDNNRSGGYRL